MHEKFAHLWPIDETENMDTTTMKVGDAVEFISDRQTEKGPSSGRVVERNGESVTIAHSDSPGESFRVEDLRVQRLSIHHKGGLLWVLE